MPLQCTAPPAAPPRRSPRCLRRTDLQPTTPANVLTKSAVSPPPTSPALHPAFPHPESNVVAELIEGSLMANYHTSEAIPDDTTPYLDSERRHTTDSTLQATAYNVCQLMAVGASNEKANFAGTDARVDRRAPRMVSDMEQTLPTGGSRSATGAHIRSTPIDLCHLIAHGASNEMAHLASSSSADCCVTSPSVLGTSPRPTVPSIRDDSSPPTAPTEQPTPVPAQIVFDLPEPCPARANLLRDRAMTWRRDQSKRSHSIHSRRTEYKQGHAPEAREALAVYRSLTFTCPADGSFVDLHNAVIDANSANSPIFTKPDGRTFGCTAIHCCSKRMRRREHRGKQSAWVDNLFVGAARLIRMPRTTQDPTVTLRPILDSHTVASLVQASIALFDCGATTDLSANASWLSPPPSPQ